MVGMLTVSILFYAQAGLSSIDLYQGKCHYPAELGPKQPSETRVDCDVAIVSPSKEPNSVMIQFASKTSGVPIGFAGDVDNSGTLSVRRIYLRPGVPTQASRGHCRIFRNGESVNGISCVGFIGMRAFVANFRASAP